jgi:hypothetical protein
MTLTSHQFLTVDGVFRIASDLQAVSLSNAGLSAGSAQTRRWLIGGENLNAFVGLNGPYRLDTDHDGNLQEEVINPTAAGFELTGLNIGLALYQEQPTPESAVLDPVATRTSSRNWVSIHATAAHAEEFGLPFVQAQARNMAVDINAGSDGSVVDYASAVLAVPMGVNPTGGPSQTIDFKGKSGTLIRASGDFALSVDQFFSISGTMGFEKSTRELTLADGTQVRADTLSFGGKNLYAFAGVGGPYWVDTNGDGIYTSADARPATTGNGGAIGLALENTNFGLLLSTALPHQKGAEGLSWSSLSASASSISVVGVSDLTLKVSNLAVDLNLVQGASADTANAKVIDFASATGPVGIVTGTGTQQWLAMKGSDGVLARASASGELRVGDFLELSGSVGLERRAQDLVLADGTRVAANMLSIAGTDLSGFVGIGPYRVDLNHDGLIAANEINPDAVGLGVRDVDFGLALFSSYNSGKQGYSHDADARWTSLTASVGAVDALVGLPSDIQFQVRDLGVDINLVSGIASHLQNSKVIDFGTREVGGQIQNRSLDLLAGPGRTLSLTHDGSRGQLVRASGGLTLDVAGFFYASGTMSIEKSARDLVLANGSVVSQASVLTIGGTHLNAFAGIHGPYRTDTNGDGRIDFNDEVSADAVGLSLSEAEFGLALFSKAGDARQWVSLQASALEVALVGVPGITASASNLSVSINQVYGTSPGTDANRQVVDFSGARAFQVYTGYNKTTTLNMQGSLGNLVRASGDFELSVADFVTARGSLGFEKSRGTVTLANGQTHTVDRLMVGGKGINVFAGSLVQPSGAALASCEAPMMPAAPTTFSTTTV